MLAIRERYAVTRSGGRRARTAKPWETYVGRDISIRKYPWINMCSPLLFLVLSRFDVVEALSRKNNDRRQGRSPVTASFTSSSEIGQANQSAPSPSQTGAIVNIHGAQQRSTPIPGLDHVLDAAAQDQSNETLVDNGLVDFYRRGIHSQTWTLFDKPSDARMCYIGTSLSNLSQLVSVERCGDGSALHYPTPQIRRIVSWKPGTDLPNFQHQSDLTHDLTLFPAQDVRDALVDAFFTEIHPGFPVVDESEFRASYIDKESPPPLLLYQAVLLGGARVCQHPKVAESRSFVKAVLYRRAKTLWDMRFENDRVTLIQAALIFSWHVETADNVSAGSYYWISVACGIAYGLGMHRNLTQSSSTVMPQPARHLFRRLWWTLFQSAVATALEHGRPLLIQMKDTDQPPLTEADLVESDGSVNRNIHLEYCVQNSTLCEIIADIMNMHSPGSLQKNSLAERGTLDCRLAAWLMALPPMRDFYMLQLSLHYNTALLHLDRTTIQMVTAPDPAYSSKLCGTATDSIVSIFGSMIQAQTIRKCYITSLTAVMAAAIHVTREMHLAIQQHMTLLALQSQSQLEALFPIMGELAQSWPTAKAILKLFQHILERSKTAMVAQSVNNVSNLDALLTPDLEYPPMDWDLIFSTLHPDDSLEHTGQDWSNVASWIRN
ncbi:hypothetical protein LTR84_011372 [Exophiala bonariae]|uniref:Xylanolytic transcriptional activator regulatory domain-containing protein n=1 Tax=Exophiala bonariae TaxID=1690606 RepID=A0AAV9MSA7_9EURO|nr:hypothetical protein LTR84_011372 [Exophiala bonariae]